MSESEPPTNLANLHYNPADMITIAVILKHPGTDGTSLFDYAYGPNGKMFSFLWPCTGLRTSDAQVFAHAGLPWAHQNNGYDVLQLFFPRLLGGKPLISGSHERVAFRMLIKQRVFEASFFVNGQDVLDGSEPSFIFPMRSRI